MEWKLVKLQTNYSYNTICFCNEIIKKNKFNAQITLVNWENQRQLSVFGYKCYVILSSKFCEL